MNESKQGVGKNLRGAKPAFGYKAWKSKAG